jgi:hypothetical protein
MCDKKVPVKVFTPESALQKDAHWKQMMIDECLAPIIDALNQAGIYTVQCCCGHGYQYGEIELVDGRFLLVCTKEQRDKLHEEYKK